MRHRQIAADRGGVSAREDGGSKLAPDLLAGVDSPHATPAARCSTLRVVPPRPTLMASTPVLRRLKDVALIEVEQKRERRKDQEHNAQGYDEQQDLRGKRRGGLRNGQRPRQQVG
jgi:hypothetical protein